MKSQTRGNLRFTHLHLENWRNFTQVDANLERRVFLIGPNASGKSNFLDVFRFLHDVVSVGGGFEEAVRKRGGVSRLRSLAARRNPDVAVRVRIGDDSESALWEYELRFAQDNRRRPTIKKERVLESGEERLNRPDELDEKDPIRLTQTYLEQVNVNKEFREVADFFGSVKYLHTVPQLIREPDRSVGRTDDPFGGDFLEQVAKTSKNTLDARLRRIQSALQVAVPQLNELDLRRDEKGTPHLWGKYEHWRPRGAWQNEEHFSDGTLRLMGLLWSVLDGAGPLLLEEPELSLHPAVIRYIPAMFGRVQRRDRRRQILLSTHSPDLLQDQGIGLDEALLLQPEREGTAVYQAGDFKDIKPLLEGGVSLADAVIPKTQPENVQQLALFGS